MFRPTNVKKQKGMTLAEFVVSLIALSLFLTALIQITRGGIRTYTKGLIQTEMKHELREAAEVITVDLRQAVPSSDGFGSLWDTDDQDKHQDISFYRFEYAGDETTQPDEVQVEYEFEEDETITYNGVAYVMANLTRTYTDADGNEYPPEIIATNIVKTQGGTKTSYFKWVEDAVDSDSSNLYLMNVTLKMMRFTPGKKTPETLQTSFNVGLGADRNQVSDSDFDSIKDSYDDITDVKTFIGRPSSLVRP